MIAILALVISLGLAFNEYRRRPKKKTVRYFFQNDNVEAMYYDEQEGYLRFPHYGSDASAGFDLRASQAVILDPGQFMMVPTGLFFDLPEGHELQIRPRSGLAAKYGITVLNTPGTVDEDYTGEVKVILINNGANRFTINYGERIAQGVLADVTSRPDSWEKVKSRQMLAVTERGSKGIGSTGVK